MHAEPAKLGSDSDPIRQMFFASQSLQEMVKTAKLDGKPSPFQSMADSFRFVQEGKKSEAISTLQGILKEPDLETRVQLWVWTALRDLGVQPDQRQGGEVLGVVIEMPMQNGYDTLAAYVDGTARYLNFSGAAIFWDQRDEKIKGLCQAFIDSTIPASNRATPRRSLNLPKSGGQVTLLTRSGIYAIPNPPESAINAGAALMIELMRRASQGK